LNLTVRLSDKPSGASVRLSDHFCLFILPDCIGV
jgi:hypothetical protein